MFNQQITFWSEWKIYCNKLKCGIFLIGFTADGCGALREGQVGCLVDVEIIFNFYFAFGPPGLYGSM